MKKNFIDVTCDSDIVNVVELNERANRTYSAVHNRSDEEKTAVLEKRKALSALGGVAELNALEGDYMMLNIYRDSPVLDFIEMRDLPLSSVPFYRTRYSTPVGFYSGSTNAMGSTLRYATNDAGAQVFPFVISTDEVEVPNISAIYDMARLEQRQTAIERLSHDLKIAIVNAALNTTFRATGNVVTYDPAQAIQDYFNNATGSFTGKNVQILDPGVQNLAVVQTNIVDAHLENGLTKGVFQAINDWRLLAKRNIRKIYVPSANTGYPVWRALQDQAQVVALVNGQGNANPAKTIPNDFFKKFQDDDFAGSVAIDWFGQNIEIEVQNWLPAGYCLVLTDRPAAIMWDRLSLATGADLAGTLEVPINGYNSRRSESRQVAMISPDYCLKNFMVLKVQ